MLKQNQQCDTTTSLFFLLLLFSAYAPFSLASSTSSGITKVCLYGTDQDTGKNRTQLHFLESSDEQSFEIEPGFAARRDLCYIAIRSDPQDSEILWLEKCLKVNESSRTIIDLEHTEQSEALVKRFQLKATRSLAQNTPDVQGILLPDQDLTLTITSPTELNSINSNFDNTVHHTSLIPWRTDENAKIAIRSNIDDLNLSFFAQIFEDPNSLSLYGQTQGNSTIVKLIVECPTDTIEVSNF